MIIKKQLIYPHYSGGLEVYSEIIDDNNDTVKSIHIINEDGVIDSEYNVLFGSKAASSQMKTSRDFLPISNPLKIMLNVNSDKKAFINIIKYNAYK